MAFFGIWIRHEICVLRKCLGHIINPTFWDLSPALLIELMQPREGFLWKFSGLSGLSSPRWDQKLILPREQCAYCSAAIKDGEFHKAFKICSKVIQRTLRSGKNWLRYSLFSVISRVKWPNLQAWPHFRAHFEFSTHTGKTRQCVPLSWKKMRPTKITEVDCARQSRLRLWNFHVEFFSRGTFYCWLKVGILPVKTPSPRMKFCYFFPNFGRPPSSARIYINFTVKWTSPNFGSEIWQGFCHPKIISYKNVPSKIPFSRSKCHKVLIFFSLPRIQSRQQLLSYAMIWIEWRTKLSRTFIRISPRCVWHAQTDSTRTILRVCVLFVCVCYVFACVPSSVGRLWLLGKEGAAV